MKFPPNNFFGNVKPNYVMCPINITAELIAGNLIARNEITRKSKFVII